MHLVTLCREDGRRLSLKHGSWWGETEGRNVQETNVSRDTLNTLETAAREESCWQPFSEVTHKLLVS
jgi:hypothetical protein